MTENDGPENVALDSTGIGVREWEGTPEADAIFHALSARARRQILFYLLETPETTDEELVDVIAGWRSTESGAVDACEGEQIAIELRHVHLPLLAGASLVEYDSATGTVRLTDLAEPVREIISFAHQYEQATQNEQ